MVCRPAKCKFGTRSVEYCGFVVDEEKYQVKPERVEAINQFHKPNTVKQLRRFL